LKVDVGGDAMLGSEGGGKVREPGSVHELFTILIILDREEFGDLCGRRDAAMRV